MIRRATPADADALSVLARECFTQTFGHLYTAEDLTAFLDQAYSPAVLRAELEDPERPTWLLFEDAPGFPSPEDEAGSLAHVSSGSPSTINTTPPVPIPRGPGKAPRPRPPSAPPSDT